ncbi:MAG TPA: hypothetical protein PKV86_05265, partial [Syntrophobacteraceae bacterium]|nr:hypothetical protein [Syntrophobacteraceae bacterium]
RGKSLLIDNNTDWRGQAGRFYPSYTVDPLLQIYLGSRALVMEVPAPLLNNTSPQARNALLRLWKPLFKGREATVVVVLNAPALLQDIPENLRRHAQVLRGKIDILSSVQKRPVKVCIALSHMDQVEGFSEFAEFLHKENLPLDISLLPDGDEKSLAACLGPYEALLPRALTSMSSDDYLKIVSFFSAAPQFLSLLSSFTRILRAPDPLSPSPRIVRLCLTSREVKDPPVSNPFLGEGTVKERVRDVPNLRHRLAATAILVTGMLYLSADYYVERSLMLELDEMLNHIDHSPLAQYDEYSHGHFMEVSEHLTKSLVMYVPPDFFPQSEDHVRWHFSRGIRNYYLLPAFRGLGQGEDAHEKGIYLLGLIYATRSNDLGRLVLANAREWTKTLNLPETLIRDYVSNNDWAKELTLDLTSMPNEHPRGIGPMDNPLSWSVFVNNVQKACEEPSINKEYLHALQKEADSFLRILDRISRYKLTNELVTLLKRYLPPGAQIDWIQRRDVLLDQEPLQQFLMKVKEKDIDYPSVVGLGLMQFIDSIRIMAKQKDLDQDGDKEYRFRLYSQEEFQFSAAKWNSLVLRSRITLFIREFLAQNKRTDGLLFFDKTGSIGFPDLVMNPSNDGMLFFVGKGKVDGRFSKSAFEQQVKPVLAELPEVLKGLPVVEEEKKRFTQFILKQAEAYADRYVSAYRTYYSQFHLAADSLGGLRYLIKQIQLPTSPFQDFLTSVKENTALDVGDSPFLRQFAKKLGTFESIRRLMAEKDGTVPELDKYKALLKQMDDEIDSNEPFTAANKADDANELKRILSPLGRISLSIQRGENDSYVSLVRMWIKSVGMDAEWQQPFLEPATIAFFVGRGDVESSVEKIWSDLEDSYLKTLFSKFPFNQKAEVEATPSELEKVIHPQGAFWKTFRDYLAPICRESSGFWTERVSPQGFFRIPQDMLPTVNELSRLTAILWND